MGFSKNIGDFIMTIGSRIKTVRKYFGFRQSFFAKLLNISQTHISKIENNKDMPSEKLLKMISSELDISLEWLKNETGDMILQDNEKKITSKELTLRMQSLLNECSNKENIKCCETMTTLIELLAKLKQFSSSMDTISSLNELLKYLLKYINYMEDNQLSKVCKSNDITQETIDKYFDENRAIEKIYKNHICSCFNSISNSISLDDELLSKYWDEYLEQNWDNI